MSDLVFLDRWRSLGESLELPAPDRELIGRELLIQHREPQRHYHSVEHVLAVLDAVDQLDAANPSTQLAAFFHDAVYEPAAAPGENEASSASLLAKRLDMNTSSVADAHAMILATASHAVGSDDPHDTAAFLDADLSILGAEPERYMQYSADIRAEYIHVPDDQFKAGRAAILKKFLDRESCFFTVRGRELWHAQAQSNLATELKLLLG